MDDDTNAIETQVDAMMARWAEEIDAFAGPSPAAVERTRSAVRHELNERWLASHPTPEPSYAALVKTREAVRHELAGKQVRFAPWFSPQMRAGLAAAAMVALGIGLVRYIGTGTMRPAPFAGDAFAAAAGHVELFVEAAQETLGEDAFAASVLSELQSIDEKLVGSSPGMSSDNVLDELDGAIRDVLDDDGPGRNTTGSALLLPEVLG